MVVPATIIVPVLNESEHLESFLRTLEGAETIVVDGGSTDASAKVVEKFNVRFVSSPRGRARQMNTGAEYAVGEVLLFLHADTRLPDAWRETIADFSKGEKVWGRFDVKFDQPSTSLAIIAAMMNWRSRVTGVCTGDQAIFVRRSAFEELGGFATIPLMEDIEFSKRLRRISMPYCSRRRVVTSGRRWRDNGVLRTVCLMWWLRLLFLMGVSPAQLVKRYYSWSDEFVKP